MHNTHLFWPGQLYRLRSFIGLKNDSVIVIHNYLNNFENILHSIKFLCFFYKMYIFKLMTRKDKTSRQFVDVISLYFFNKILEKYQSLIKEFCISLQNSRFSIKSYSCVIFILTTTKKNVVIKTCRTILFSALIAILEQLGI